MWGYTWYSGRQGRKISIPELDCVLHEDPCDFKVLERMQRLYLDINVLDGKDNVRPYVEQFLTELFESCPNLKLIQFDFTSWYVRTWATDFLTSDSVNLTKLSVLDHLIDPDLNQVHNLQRKGFPLSKLRLRIRYKDVTVEDLHKLLISVSSTLTDLQVVFMDYSCAKEFPSSTHLVKLKRFELWRYKGQLGFILDFKSLEELVLGEVELKGQELFCSKHIVKGRLEGVKVTFKDYWDQGRIFS